MKKKVTSYFQSDSANPHTNYNTTRDATKKIQSHMPFEEKEKLVEQDPKELKRNK